MERFTRSKKFGKSPYRYVGIIITAELGKRFEIKVKNDLKIPEKSEISLNFPSIIDIRSLFEKDLLENYKAKKVQFRNCITVDLIYFQTKKDDLYKKEA